MEILKVVPKQVFVEISFSLEELQQFVLILDHAEFKYDYNNFKAKEADEMVRKMYNNFKDLIKEFGDVT